MGPRPTDWYVLDLDADPTPGDPFGIRELARRMMTLSSDAADAAARVRQAGGSDAVQSWVGASGDAYREEIGGFPGDLDKLSTSYGMAGRALTTYAGSLDGAQGQADTALARGREARSRLTSAQTALSSARSAEATSARAVDTARSPTAVAASIPAGGGAAPPPPDPAAVSAAVRSHTAAQTRLSQAQAVVGDAQGDLDAARRLALAAKGLRETAENAAEHELHAASHAGIHNKHWWQKLGDALAKGWHVLVQVAKVVVLVLGVVALIIGGPLAWIVFAAALIVLADTLVKYAQGKASLWDVALAALACIPMTKGLTSLGEIATALREGEGLLGAGRLVVAGGRTQLAEMANAARGLGRGLTTIVKGLPAALADSIRLGEAVTPEGVRILSMGADAGPLRDLLMAASANARGGSDIAWTGEGGVTLNAADNATVDEFVARATDAEPGIRAALHSPVHEVPGGQLQGLENKLKTADSLKRKVATALIGARDKSAADVLANIKDSVRYTAEIPGESYAQGVAKITTDMRSAGFEQLGQLKNSWGGSGYQGINSSWRDPASGHIFEVQFHTPQSFHAKTVTHGLYDDIRLPSTPPAVRETLERQQDEIFSKVPLPPGATEIR